MEKEQSIHQKVKWINIVYKEYQTLKSTTKAMKAFIDEREDKQPKTDVTLYDNMCRRITTLEVKLNKLPEQL